MSGIERIVFVERGSVLTSGIRAVFRGERPVKNAKKRGDFNPK